MSGKLLAIWLSPASGGQDTEVFKHTVVPSVVNGSMQGRRCNALNDWADTGMFCGYQKPQTGQQRTAIRIVLRDHRNIFNGIPEGNHRPGPKVRFPSQKSRASTPPGEERACSGPR